MAFATNTKSTCGDRCVYVNVFQAKADPTDSISAVDQAQFFRCNNTIPPVRNLPSLNPTACEMPNQIALMLAGNIGFRGDSSDPSAAWQYSIFDELNNQNFIQSTVTNATLGPLSEIQVSTIIASFSIAAVAEIDNDPSQLSRTYVQGAEPIYADFLQVTWWYAGPLLICIPALHFVSLLCVIMWANRAVIRDDSFLAVAKLYESMITQLEGHGCVLRGEQMIEVLADPVVVYGYQDGSTPHGVKHMGVFEQESGFKPSTCFAEGQYDGTDADDRSSAKKTTED